MNECSPRVRTSVTALTDPSLIRVPSWVKNPLGKYYLYFAHHTGKYIRLGVRGQARRTLGNV